MVLKDQEVLPEFETERLLLKPRTMADFDACIAMDRDPDVTKFIPGPWADPAAHERFVKERIQTSFGEGLGYWSIFSKQSPNQTLGETLGQFAGWILLIPCDEAGGEGSEIEIGWRLNRHSWGKGYATEAAIPIARHAFQTVGVSRIIADIHPQNSGSLRVAEKIGMTFIGDNEFNGEPCKSYVMTG